MTLARRASGHARRRRGVVGALVLAGLVIVAAPTVHAQPADSERQTPAPGSAWSERSRLSGDWGGSRTRMEDVGVKLDADATLFYQGLVRGTGPKSFEFGGRLDGFAKLDTGKLGLWDGGGVVAHLEYVTGNLPGSLGGSFFPTNSGMEFPSDASDKLVATSLYVTQRFERASLLVGKINALDLLENDLFFGGWGTRRFMNAVFAAPPSGLVPPVFMGAIGSYRWDSASVSLWVYDPKDRTNDYTPAGLFDDGVTLYLTPSWSTLVGGRPTTFSLTGIYTTKSGVDFSSISQPYRAAVPFSTKQGSYSVGFQVSHMLHVDPGNPRRGWGVHAKGAVSDGNPNYVQRSIIAGLGGTGLFRGRDLDAFGAGYFYYDLSDDLQAMLSPGNDRFRDEQGAEVYYAYALAPWCFVTADIQYIAPPRRSLDNALIAALRLNVRF